MTRPLLPPSVLVVAMLACAIVAISAPRPAAQGGQLVQATPGAQPPVVGPHFSTRTEFVRVDTLVTAHGVSVAGLRGEDFELRDNGVPQRVTVMDASSLPVDVAMALDVSGSVDGTPLVNLRSAATGLIDGLREGDRVALVSFSDLLVIHSPLTTDFLQVRRLIGQMTAIGRTSLRDAAYAALLQSDPDAGRAFIVLFTDGQDISSWLSDAALIDTAKRVNTVVYSVALAAPTNSIWDAPQDEILNQLPNLTGGRRLSADDPARLRDLFATIIREFRERYVLTYIPQGVDRAGYHTLDVRLPNPAEPKSTPAPATSARASAKPAACRRVSA